MFLLLVYQPCSVLEHLTHTHTQLWEQTGRHWPVRIEEAIVGY